MGGRSSSGNRNIRTVDSILGNNPKLEQAVEKAFDKANLMDEPDIYKALYSYKIIRELNNTDVEILYDYLAERLFGRN